MDFMPDKDQAASVTIADVKRLLLFMDAWRQADVALCEGVEWKQTDLAFANARAGLSDKDWRLLIGILGEDVEAALAP